MTKGPTLPKMTLEESRRQQPKTSTEYRTPDGHRYDPRNLRAQRNNELAGRGRHRHIPHGGEKISYARH